jgi:hypothetical protein
LSSSILAKRLTSLCTFSALLVLRRTASGWSGPTRIAFSRPSLPTPFPGVFRLRTMVPDAETLLQRMLAEDKEPREQYLTYHKLRDDPTPLLWPSHARLDHVAPPINLSVEARTPTWTRGATLFLVFAFGDGVGDVPPAQQLATTLEAVASVGDHMMRSLPRPARRTCGGCSPYFIEKSLKLRAAVALSGSHDHRERTALAVAGEVHLGGESAIAAPQSLIFGV